jgi:hypothetical protein
MFDSFSKNKAVGMERMSSMLRTQGIIKNEGGALDNLIHKKQKTVDKKMISRLFKMVDEQKRHYISIKEISSTYENTNIELVINTIKLIDMNDYFIDVLRKLDKIDTIKIIFQEFIKVIDYIRPELLL